MSPVPPIRPLIIRRAGTPLWSKLSLALMALVIVVLIKIIANTGDLIGSLQSQIHDRDFALDITAHAVNTQQGMLDNRARHIQQLESALSGCIAICTAPPAK